MATEYQIQGWYGWGYGWETVTTENSYPQAQIRLREYYDNEPLVRFRIYKVKLKNRDK